MDGKGNFTSVKSAATGFNADNDVKSLAQIEAANGTAIILTGNNNSELRAYQMQTKGMIIIPIKNTDVYAIIQKKNGQSCKQEFYYGSNYLSQTSRKLIVSKEVVHVTLVDNKGIKREQILN